MAVTEDQLITCENMKKRFGGGVTADQILYSGTIVFIDAANGFMTGVTNGGANAVAGVAPQKVDATGTSDGDLNTDLLVGCFKLVGTGFAQTDVGARVFASDNYTVTKTGAGNSYIGTIREYISSTEVMVDIDRHAPSEA